MSHTTHRRFTFLLFAMALLLVPAALGAAAQQTEPVDDATPVAVPSDAGAAHQGEIQLATNCTDNSDCASTEYCFKGGFRCGGRGNCELRPEFCILIFDPVCGCDGQTYGNACLAANAGVNVASEGECP